jgi:hypothetical protein
MSSDTKKECLTRSTPRNKNSTTILPTVDGLAADLRQLQDDRQQRKVTPSPAFIAASKKISDPIDWLMFAFPGSAEPFIHRLVDRLMQGDAKAEQHVATVRQEMGL